ncbi:hypothetical protein FV232_01080 [Methylobacterium sp. WL30]|uniref:hypothetical protein n=1 Tax=unclassified Methylobacterium TaxID=2615210 RepID=UPI0011C933C5|nr:MULTISPECIES: hypothetical protein [unclassified Methylobacterium]TXN38747.1 hypothetical protein FV225_12650 [Methylobacterium sp. WL93]TXN52241.1 hypothetical protein FV227_04090 [Methylobacterium sp. WL119]TXN70676.1 hypothetical protein FV232_01080 [Methylobacterium sp. WL30]
MSAAPPITITAEEHEELRCFAERVEATFCIMRAENRTLRLAHAGMRDALYDVLTLLGASRNEEAFDTIRGLMTVAEIHAQEMRVSALPAGVADLAETRRRRVAPRTDGRAL